MDQAESANSNYYAILNVPRDASQDDIRRAHHALAAVAHPDKNASDVTTASANFMRVQAAYEVLSDPDKRTVYDVYGEEGLRAGMELSTDVRDIRSAYERIKAKQAAQALQEQVAHTGRYVFQVDASSLVAPYDRRSATAPELQSVAMSSQVMVPLTEKMAAIVAGEIAVHKALGGGSFIAGIKRVVSPNDDLDVELALGLKNLLHVSANRKLNERSSASLGATWVAGAGLSMRFSTQRRLDARTEAAFSWALGPAGEGGVALTVTHRRERFLFNAKLELGAPTAISARVLYMAGPGVTVNASARLWVKGLEGFGATLEFGATQRVLAHSTAGFITSIGTGGVMVKPSFKRGSHTFLFPVVLAAYESSSWQIMLGAGVLPPLAGLLLKYCVVRPLRRRYKLHKVLELRAALAEAVAEGRASAAAAEGLVAPVAARKLRQEVEQGGLVVVDARYGVLEAILAEEAAEAAAAAANRADPPAGSSSGEVGAGEAEAGSPDAVGPDAEGPEASPCGGGGGGAGGREGGRDRWRERGEEAEEDDDDDEEDAAAIAADAAAAQPPPPPPWIDVTLATRFLVSRGRIVLHQARAKNPKL